MILFFLPLFSCTNTTTNERTADQEPTFIIVEALGSTGSFEEPMEFSADPLSYEISVETLDSNAAPHAFNGNLKLGIRPGRLASDIDPWITVVDGKWSGEISFRAAFGPSPCC